MIKYRNCSIDLIKYMRLSLINNKYIINPLALHQNFKICIIKSSKTLLFIFIETSNITAPILIDLSAKTWTHSVQKLSFKDWIVFVTDTVNAHRFMPVFVNLSGIHSVLKFNVIIIKNFFIKAQWDFRVRFKVFKFQNS